MARRTRRTAGDGQGGGDDRSEEEPADPIRQAKDVCLRLLTSRPRTRAELHQALLRKGFEEDTAEHVLGRLDKAGLVDDASFAEMWVRSRHTHQGLGRKALAAELRRKGVDDAVTAQAVAEVDSAAEAERARELVRKKLRGMSASSSVDDAAKVRRLVGMLARKGYPEGLAFRVVREELRAAGAESTPLDDAVPGSLD
ncbi:MAG: regulatory protein RecX [Pseudonocardiaceae bacterium]|nr:regulatory protein RecX [Pseudonocardiaceae bacterium]